MVVLGSRKALYSDLKPEFHPFWLFSHTILLIRSSIYFILVTEIFMCNLGACYKKYFRIGNTCYPKHFHEENNITLSRGGQVPYLRIQYFWPSLMSSCLIHIWCLRKMARMTTRCPFEWTRRSFFRELILKVERSLSWIQHIKKDLAIWDEI